jgi:hypothetical protein
MFCHMVKYSDVNECIRLVNVSQHQVSWTLEDINDAGNIEYCKALDAFVDKYITQTTMQL